jgi:formate dehydrogenase iron-sulfur subunit
MADKVSPVEALPPASREYGEIGPVSDKPRWGMVVDQERCIGCWSCAVICKSENDVPLGMWWNRIDTVGEAVDTPFLEHGDLEMHWMPLACQDCENPPCTKVCPVAATYKRDDGIVMMDNERCIGCRYCMVACPFDVPKFEYNTPFPKIQKCTFCWEKRSSKGEKPACVEICPAEVMFFGTRKEVMEEARLRIYQNPETYYHGIYGEHEVGGTSWVYIGAVPFEKLGWRTDLGTTPYPKLSKGFLTNIAVIDLVVPALLLGISYATKKNNEQ